MAPPSAAPAYDLGTALNRLQFGRGGGAVQASSTFGWLPICSTNGQGNASYGVCSPMTERRDWCVEATGVGGHPTTFIPLARDDWAEAPPFGGSQPGPPGAAFEEPVLVPVRGDGVYGGRIFKSWIDFGTWGQPPKDRSLRLVFSEPSWVWSNASAHEAGDRPVIPLKTTDAAAERAMLFFDDHFLSSSHGLSAPKILSWWPWGKWTSKTIDPGYSVFRNPLDTTEVVVTARPQALRDSSGRHAGFHSSTGWQGLASSLNQRALPLDELFETDDQIYGLPSFAYGGMVVSYFWRYHCRPAGHRQHTTVLVQEQCFRGGVVSAALAFSYNSRNWSAFGLPAASSSGVVRGAPSPAGVVVGRKLLNNTDLGYPESYHHSYQHYTNKTAGAMACQRECDDDGKCIGWTYVTGDDASERERCCRHSAFGCPRPVTGFIAAAKKPTPCTPSPPPPLRANRRCLDRTVCHFQSSFPTLQIHRRRRRYTPIRLSSSLNMAEFSSTHLHRRTSTGLLAPRPARGAACSRTSCDGMDSVTSRPPVRVSVPHSRQSRWSGWRASCLSTPTAVNRAAR